MPLEPARARASESPVSGRITIVHGDGRDPAARDAQRLGRHEAHFAGIFGAGAPVRLFFSPGRINLMGAHLDYNGGPVMPSAIDRGTFLAARRRTDRRIVLVSTLDEAERVEVDLDALPARAGRWADYPLGVIVEMRALAEAKGALGRLSGLDVSFGGDLPVGAGLSSSASICVGTAFALERLWELGLERMDLVDVAWKAERGFVGVQCGIMDPWAVGLARAGSLLWIDCKDRSREYIPLDTRTTSIVVADSLVRRSLAQGQFNERVQQCAQAFAALARHQPGAEVLRDIRLDTWSAHQHELAPVIARRARHVVTEVERTFAARDALLRGDVRAFAATMFRTHASLRDDFEVSVPELDTLVESAERTPGCLGARLTGAGFGGCAVALLETGSESDAAARLTADFERRFGKRPRIEFFAGDSGPREIEPA
jgi:galactokinase